MIVAECICFWLIDTAFLLWFVHFALRKLFSNILYGSSHFICPYTN